MKKNGTPPKPVGIWIRVSHEDSVERESPEHHEHRARAYAEIKGWKVVKVYRLDAVSGKSVKDHPETRKMLQDVQEGVIDALIFSKLARLARNTRELLDFADFFQEHDADLISLQESIDTSSPAGRLFYTMIAALAQWEREEISARVAASVPVRAKMGKSTGGTAPFGYQWVDGELVINEEEAPVCKHIFELFREHKRYKAVSRLLNDAGHRTRRGSPFSDATIKRLLANPIFKGKRRANYTTKTGGGSWELKPEEEWVFTDVEPIVSDELWSAVNAIMDSRRKKDPKFGRRGRTPVHLFSGLTFCHCGQKMYPRKATPKYICSACNNKIPIDDLNRVFLEQLKSFLISPDDVSNFLSRAESAVKEKEDLLAVLTKEQVAVETEMEKVYRLYVDDAITPSGFGSRYKPLEERQKQLEEEIPRLMGEIDSLKIQYLSNDDVFSEANDIIEKWPRFGFDEKRSIVENLVDHVVIQENRVILELTFAPDHPPFPRSDKKAMNPPGFAKSWQGRRLVPGFQNEPCSGIPK